jgi:hypothetical protein
MSQTTWKCGDPSVNGGANVQATLCPTNDTLTISGTGAIADYSSTDFPTFMPEWYAFRASITTAIIDSGVTTIGQDAFAYCSNLVSVTIPNSVTSIEYAAFYDCHSLQTVIIPNSVITIGNWAFAHCSNLQTVTIGNSVTDIGENAFQDCSDLKTISIPNCVITIGSWAFRGCSSLIDITIGSGVDTIGYRAFSNCNNLASITSLAVVPPKLGTNVFSGVEDTVPVYVPCQSVSAYSNDPNWSSYFRNIVAKKDTSSIMEAICSGQSYDVAPFSNKTTAGTYYETLKNACNIDSVILLTLIVNPSVPVTPLTASICNGSVYSFAGKSLTTADVYYDTLHTILGCDSVIQLTLNIYPSVPPTNYSATISQGGAYNDANFSNLTTAGTYSKTRQNVNGCDSVVVLTLTVTVGIAEATHALTLRVYPNPTSNQLRIENYELRMGDIAIYDVVGKLQQSKIVNLQSEISIDISHLANGLYFLKVGDKTVKVIKE